MIGRKSKRESETEVVEPKWFDDFDLRLGDMMRGERATMGKSLLDVQRELRIKASYIAAIENADPTAFDTPGFIAGYVRSYARYLNMDPDKAFAAFCAESGFSTAHGMSAAASTIRKSDVPEKNIGLGREEPDPLLRNGLGAAPAGDGFLSRIEPRAVGSTFVLLALVAGLGFGGWSVLNEVQRVQVVPVEHTPDVLADLDPLESAGRASDVVGGGDTLAASGAGVFAPPPSNGVDSLYRPRALDVPVMVARDAPISTLDPSSVGTFAAQLPDSATPFAVAANGAPNSTPKVIEDQAEGVVLFAVRPAWVRVRSSDGTVIFEKTLDAGEEFRLPADEEAPTLQAGMSGSLYFDVDGELFGPVGQGTATVRNLSMARADLLDAYEPADLSRDPELAKVIALADAQQLTTPQE